MVVTAGGSCQECFVDLFLRRAHAATSKRRRNVTPSSEPASRASCRPAHFGNNLLDARLGEGIDGTGEAEDRDEGVVGGAPG